MFWEFAVLLLLSLQVFAENDGFIRDCSNVTSQGIYHLRTEDGIEFDVLCDNDGPDGGWTYVMHRNSGKIDFENRSKSEFKSGFGELDLDEEYFIGLEKLYALSKTNLQNLLVKMVDFDGNLLLTQIFGFAVFDEEMRYEYNVDGYEGTEIGMPRYASGFFFRDSNRISDRRIPGWLFFGKKYSPKTQTRLNLFGPYPKPGAPTYSESMGLYNEETGELKPLRSIKVMMRPKKILYNLSEEVVYSS